LLNEQSCIGEKTFSHVSLLFRIKRSGVGTISETACHFGKMGKPTGFLKFDLKNLTGRYSDVLFIFLSEHNIMSATDKGEKPFKPPEISPEAI